jgi:hypothetical protein
MFVRLQRTIVRLVLGDNDESSIVCALDATGRMLWLVNSTDFIDSFNHVQK